MPDQDSDANLKGADAPKKPEADFYLSPLAETQYEFRIRYDDRVLLTCDWESYDRVKKRFPKSKGYIHEGRELTPWLPPKEVGAALVPLRSLLWDILEHDAEEYERIAAVQKGLMDEGSSIATGAWQAYSEAASNLRRLISMWRDNY